MMEVEQTRGPSELPKELDNDDAASQGEKEAVEKLKNADWTPTNGSKHNEGFEGQAFSTEGGRKRIVHQRKGDTVNTNSTRNVRSVTQKSKKRNVQK